MSQVALALVEQFAEAEQDSGALGQRGVPPGREGRGGGVDDGLRIGDTAEGDLTGHPPGRGVGHRRGRTGVALEERAVEPVLNGGLHRDGARFLSVVISVWGLRVAASDTECLCLRADRYSV